ncbi:hypothetical protein [Rhodococcus globerulus]|uniref:Restriction system protein n=1 Tax=Rhodococcus globerulus TaxID=33008 RepID=A0ABU4BZE2_RHOGO|nr:hypothetical protein [Rhodococcus globerulus]MDV6269615.1 hypothetical protein [Rhodococcus globerulus]
MAKRRGFFAEMQHQARLQEQRQRQQQRASAQAHARAAREAERSRREWERARAADVRHAAAMSALDAKEQARLHHESRLAEVELLNAELAEKLEEIDGILAATLEIDDYVDLASLRQKIEHPPFDRSDLTEMTPLPGQLPYPPEPVYIEPPAPVGFGAMLGGKKRHAAEISNAHTAYWQSRQGWEQAVAQRNDAQQRIDLAYKDAESRRMQNLAAAREQYEAECVRRRTEVLAANVRLEKLMVGLQGREPVALEEYVSIVLGNSVYPECFEVEYDFRFNGGDRELTLAVIVPHPEQLPSEKAFKYTKSSDTISSTQLPVKARKERYTAAVSQVAIRTAHEIFEADRDAVVSTLSMTVGVSTVDPATGLDTFIPLVQLATDRETFSRLDLSRVDARATLDHLRAGVSKNPYDLVAVGNAFGVRG